MTGDLNTRTLVAACEHNVSIDASHGTWCLGIASYVYDVCFRFYCTKRNRRVNEARCRAGWGCGYLHRARDLVRDSTSLASSRGVVHKPQAADEANPISPCISTQALFLASYFRTFFAQSHTGKKMSKSRLGSEWVLVYWYHSSSQEKDSWARPQLGTWTQARSWNQTGSWIRTGSWNRVYPSLIQEPGFAQGREP